MKIPLRLVAVAICAPGLFGCAASATPGWDAGFGDSIRMLAAQQVLDPAAPARNGQALQPVDGRTTREAMERHLDTYRAPPAPTIINIGGGGGR